MPRYAKTEASRILKELTRVGKQWFSNHVDRKVLTDASALITRLSKYQARRRTPPTEREELLDLLHLLDQYIVSGKSKTYAGSNLERRVHVILESRK